MVQFWAVGKVDPLFGLLLNRIYAAPVDYF